MASNRSYNDPIMFGLQNLASGAQRGLDERFKILSQLQKQRVDQQKQQQQQDALSKILPPELVNAPPAIQTAYYKNSLRPESFSEMIGRYFGGGRQSAGMGNTQQNPYATSLVYNEQQQPIGVQVGNNIVPMTELSPETQNNLAMLQQPQQDSTALQKLGQLATGALSQVAGTPGDILQLASSIIGKLPISSKEPNTEQRAVSLQHWKNKLTGLTPGTPAYSQAEEIINNLEQGPQQIQFPGTETIRKKAIPALTKGTALEKYTVPNTESDEFLQDIGGTTALLTQPSRSIPTLAMNALKALGIATGGNLAGWLTKEATGSESLGNIVKNGSYLMYSLFPGLPGRLAKKGYAEYTDKVIKPALAEGKMVDMKPYQNKFNEISQKIDKRFPVTSEAADFLRNEAAKVQDLMKYQSKINPDALWNNIKEMNNYFNKVPAQAKGVFNDLIKLQKDALIKFSDTIAPNGGRLFENANNLERTSHLLKNDFSFIKHATNPRNYGAGALFMLTGGGYPALLKVGLAAAGGKFASRMLSSPAVRDTVTQLAKASAAQNTALVNRLVNRLDKETDVILSKMSPEDQQKIRAALEEARNSSESQQ